MFLKFAFLAALAAMAYTESIQMYPYFNTQERPPGTDESQKGCLISDLGNGSDTVIPFNTREKPYYPDTGECYIYVCEEETWNAYRFGCDTVKEKEGCEITKADKSKKYPGCCDRQVCDNNDDNNPPKTKTNTPV